MISEETIRDGFLALTAVAGVLNTWLVHRLGRSTRRLHGDVRDNLSAVRSAAAEVRRVRQMGELAIQVAQDARAREGMTRRAGDPKPGSAR